MNLTPGEHLLRMFALQRMAQNVQGAHNDGARIREIDPDEDNEPNHGHANTQVSCIEKLLHLEESISSYMEEGKYEEAYGLVKKQYKQGPKAHFLKALINYYIVLMHTNRPEKAVKIEKEIISILQDTIEVSPKDAYLHAEQAQSDSKLFEAILFFHIGQELCKAETDPAEIINSLQHCALGTKLTVAKLIKKRDVSKVLVKKHIIPEMKNLCLQISRVQNADRKQSCIIEAVCMHHLENIQQEVGDTGGRETTLKGVITLMDDILGDAAEKFHVYSGALNNLGQVYLEQNKPQDALRMLTTAMEKRKKAEDYATVLEKQLALKKCENAIKLVKSLLP